MRPGATPWESMPCISREFVEQLVDERYGMTRHAMASHAPEGAIFAVSSFGSSASGQPAPGRLRAWASMARWAGLPTSLRPAIALTT